MKVLWKLVKWPFQFLFGIIGVAFVLAGGAIAAIGALIINPVEFAKKYKEFRPNGRT